jgi:hypothetical protein
MSILCSGELLLKDRCAAAERSLSRAVAGATLAVKTSGRVYLDA